MWGAVAVPALAALRQALATVGIRISDDADRLVVELEELAEELAGDQEGHKQACKWVVEHIPIFVYLDEYPALLGNQNVADYVGRKSQGEDHLTDADRNFEKLCKVASLSPQQLEQLLAKGENETRNQLANRAGAVVTAEIRRLWKDRGSSGASGHG